MQNQKKWLMLGGGILVLAALGLAIGLNQGNLFKGSVTDLDSMNIQNSANPLSFLRRTSNEDNSAAMQASGQNPKYILDTYTAADGKIYNLLVDESLVNSGRITNTNTGLVFDNSKVGEGSGAIYFRTEEKMAVKTDGDGLTVPGAIETPAIETPAEAITNKAIRLMPSISDGEPTGVIKSATRGITPSGIPPAAVPSAAPSASLIHRAHAAISNTITITADSSGTFAFEPSDYPNGLHYDIYFYNFDKTLNKVWKDAAIVGSTCSDIDQFGLKPDSLTVAVDSDPLKVTGFIYGINDGNPILTPGTSDFAPIFLKGALNPAICLASLDYTFASKYINVRLEQSDDKTKAVEDALANSVFSNFINFSTLGADSKFELDLSIAFTAGKGVGGAIGIIDPTLGKTYNLTLEGDKPGFTKPLPITLLAGKTVPPVIVDVSAVITSTPSSKDITPGTSNADVLGVSFRNVSSDDKVITDMTFTGLIKDDPIGVYEEGTVGATGNSLVTIVSKNTLKSSEIGSTPAHATMPASGKLVFSGLNFNVPKGSTTNFILSGDLINTPPTTTNDVNFKYVLSEVQFSTKTYLDNSADKNDTVVMTIPKGAKPCNPLSNFAFNPAKLTYDISAPKNPQSTLFSAYAGVKDLGLNFDNICLPDLIAAGFDPKAEGIFIELRDGSNVITSEAIKLDKGVVFPMTALEKYLTLDNVDSAGKHYVDGTSTGNSYLSLSSDFTKNTFTALGKKLENNKPYTIELSTAITVGGTLVKSPKPLANYQVEMVDKAAACIPVDKFAFSPAKLTYDENAPKSPQFTDLSAYTGTTKLGMKIDSFCKADLTKSGFDPNAAGIYLELKDGADIIAAESVKIDKAPSLIKLLENYISLDQVDSAGKPFDSTSTGNAYVRFNTDLTKTDFGPLGKKIVNNKTYNIEAHTVTEVAGKLVNNPNVFATFQIERLSKSGAPVVPPVVPPATPVTYVTNNYTTVTTAATKPSIEPCVVNGKNFYLADGPNSSYCKDLQDAKIFSTDLGPETQGVRYVTALAAVKVMQDLGATVKTKNLPSNWESKFTDDFNRNATNSEKADFQRVVATGVLTGRIDPKDRSVSLDPRGATNFAELLALYQHTVENQGVNITVKEANLPADILAEYKSNPDWKWIAEAYSFGVEYKMITKGQFNKSNIFNSTDRGDLADFVANFRTAVKAKPSLLGK